jgi:hypothetical protein
MSLERVERLSSGAGDGGVSRVPRRLVMVIAVGTAVVIAVG